MEKPSSIHSENDKVDFDCKYELEKYKITLDFLKFEATTLWQIFNAFFVGNAIFISIISAAIIKNDNEKFNFILLLISAVIGLFISILWYGTFRSNTNWYYFRMQQQAKKSEKHFVKCIGDSDWYLLNFKDNNTHNKI